MNNLVFDLVVIGSGPGGEVAAIRAAQLGLKVALVEKSPHLGGTCLNVGCIPTKALLGSASTYTKLLKAEKEGFSTGPIKFHWDKIMERKAQVVDGGRKGLVFLMKKNKVEVFHGVGSLRSRTEVEVLQDGKNPVRMTTKFVLLATGSRVRELPFVQANHRNIMTSDSILSLASVPKSMAVIGGGVVGMEFASCFGRFGTQVTVIELGAQILPSEDGEVVREAEKLYKKQNITLQTKTKLTAIHDKGDHVIVECEGQAPQKFALALLSVGRVPVTEGLGLEKLGLALDRGFVPVDQHYRTKFENIYAIGDVINTPALAHTASAEGIHAVEFMAGHAPHVINYDANPNAVYSYPEIASMGKTEEGLKSAGISYKVAKFPFAPMAKAKIDDATDGFVKILFEPKYREILGVHILGAKATEMIAEFVVGKVLETTLDELAMAIHPHPTLSEVAMEAAHAGLGGAIHM
jgi:dihydrolipoamide dehydrogenase